MEACEVAVATLLGSGSSREPADTSWSAGSAEARCGNVLERWRRGPCGLAAATGVSGQSFPNPSQRAAAVTEEECPCAWQAEEEGEVKEDDSGIGGRRVGGSEEV